MALIPWLIEQFGPSRSERAMSLLGTPSRAYQLSPEERFGEEQIPGLMQAGTGYLGSQRTPEDLFRLQAGLADIYTPQETGGLMSALFPQQEQKPTSLMQNLQAGGLQPGTQEYQQAMLEAVMKPATEINLTPKVPGGYIPQTDAQGNITGAIPIPGTPDHIKAQDTVNSAMMGLGVVDDMLASIEESGSEFFGAESGRQAQMYGQILSEIAKLRGLGVLQPGEVEMMQAQLTDPSTMSGMFTSRKTMKAQYAKVREMLANKLENYRKQYKGWGITMPETPRTPPRTTPTPAQAREELRRRRGY